MNKYKEKERKKQEKELRSLEEIDKNQQYISDLSKKTKKFYDGKQTNMNEETNMKNKHE